MYTFKPVDALKRSILSLLLISIEMMKSESHQGFQMVSYFIYNSVQFN